MTGVRAGAGLNDADPMAGVTSPDRRLQAVQQGLGPALATSTSSGLTSLTGETGLLKLVLVIQ